MKIFVDTANLEEIATALKNWWIDGVTTNPSLLAKEPKGKFEEHIGKILDLISQYKRGAHLSVEVFSRDPKEILKQAQDFKELFARKFQAESLSVKVQIGWNELEAICMLADAGIAVNCTACMTVSQAVWAAKAGARYASLFWGRIRDGSPEAILAKKSPTWTSDSAESKYYGSQYIEARRLFNENGKGYFNPVSVVNRTRKVFDREKFNCEIIAGSMRSVWDVRDAMLAGAHIVTVPYKFFPDFPKMVKHFKTDEVVDQFLHDFEAWLR